jgi:ABC-type glycerol-3-phosphate transport system substrate-binding protein
MIKARLALASGAVLLLAACGSSRGSHPGPSSATSATTPTFTSAPSSSAPGTTPAASAAPLSVYAAKFQEIGRPSEKLQNEFQALPSDTTLAEAQPLATRIVTATQKGNAQLLRETWPPQVEKDIRAMVIADGPVLGDLADLENGQDRLVTDSGTANAAYNIVLADLGLPPVN